MEGETRIRSYFKEQVRLVIEQSTHEPEGFLSYFIDHEPKDEEILGLHKMIAADVMDQGTAGRYRTIAVLVGRYLPPSRKTFPG